MFIYSLAVVALLFGCQTARIARQKGLTGDEWHVYNKSSPGSTPTWSYGIEDSLMLFTEAGKVQRVLAPQSDTAQPRVTLLRLGIDIDVLTIPIKYRQGLRGVPPALSAYFSGALYLGYRLDWQRIHYKPSWKGSYKRVVRPFALSVGSMAGLSQARIDYTSTRGVAGSLEYEGVALMQGFAAIVSVSQVNFGASLGFDYLLDKNRSIWAHQMQPWVGLVIGLNLN